MSPRGQLQNEKMRAKTLEKITTAALDVFADYGYHGSTMKQITKATGLSYGLVYHYFPSKEAIFRYLVDFALESSVSIFDKALDVSGSAWEKIDNLSKVLVENALTAESSQLFIIMMQAMTQGKSIPGLSDHIEKYSRLISEKLVPLISEAQTSGQVIEGDPVVLAVAYFSFVQGLMALQEWDIKKNITSELVSNVLRKDG